MRMKGEGKLHTISAKSCVLAGTGGANVGACVSCRTFSCATTSLGSCLLYVVLASGLRLVGCGDAHVKV
jgi:hypothetical protein